MWIVSVVSHGSRNANALTTSFARSDHTSRSPYTFRIAHEVSQRTVRYCQRHRYRRGAATLRLTQDARVARIDEVRCRPPTQIVFLHACLGKTLPPLVLAGCDRPEQRITANLLMAAGVIYFVKFVSGAEFGADRVPQEFHQFDTLDRRHAAGAPDIKVQ